MKLINNGNVQILYMNRFEWDFVENPMEIYKLKEGDVVHFTDSKTVCICKTIKILEEI